MYLSATDMTSMAPSAATTNRMPPTGPQRSNKAVGIINSRTEIGPGIQMNAEAEGARSA